jgi:hypothetical protein
VVGRVRIRFRGKLHRVRVRVRVRVRGKLHSI